MLRVGTSGWQYRDWKGVLYPDDLPISRWLEHYAKAFDTLEVNSTFYRLPRRETFADWASRTPRDFAFVLKASRYLTHIRRLRDPRVPVRRLLDAADPLGDRLAAVLLQLPPTMPIELERLDETLDAFPRGLRVAVEPRHASWRTTELFDHLAKRDVALVLADRRGPRPPLERTASWCYVRMHEGVASPKPCYGDRALRSWSKRIHGLWGRRADGFVFFNNDPGGCAVENARRFGELAT